MKKHFLAGGFRRARWLGLVAVLGAVASVDSSRAAFLDPGATGTKIRASSLTASCAISSARSIKVSSRIP